MNSTFCSIYDSSTDELNDIDLAISLRNNVLSNGFQWSDTILGITSITYRNQEDINRLPLDTNDSAIVLQKITIWGGIQHIPENFCKYANLVTTITIPYGVVDIGNSAFQNCSGLKKVLIPTSITSIGEFAFQNVSSRCEFIIVDDDGNAVETPSEYEYLYDFINNRGFTVSERELRTNDSGSIKKPLLAKRDTSTSEDDNNPITYGCEISSGDLRYYGDVTIIPEYEVNIPSAMGTYFGLIAEKTDHQSFLETLNTIFSIESVIAFAGALTLDVVLKSLTTIGEKIANKIIEREKIGYKYSFSSYGDYDTTLVDGSNQKSVITVMNEIRDMIKPFFETQYKTLTTTLRDAELAYFCSLDENEIDGAIETFRNAVVLTLVDLNGGDMVLGYNFRLPDIGNIIRQEIHNAKAEDESKVGDIPISVFHDEKWKKYGNGNIDYVLAFLNKCVFIYNFFVLWVEKIIYSDDLLKQYVNEVNYTIQGQYQFSEYHYKCNDKQNIVKSNIQDNVEDSTGYYEQVLTMPNITSLPDSNRIPFSIKDYEVLSKHKDINIIEVKKNEDGNLTIKYSCPKDMRYLALDNLQIKIKEYGDEETYYSIVPVINKSVGYIQIDATYNKPVTNNASHESTDEDGYVYTYFVQKCAEPNGCVFSSTSEAMDGLKTLRQKYGSGFEDWEVLWDGVVNGIHTQRKRMKQFVILPRTNKYGSFCSYVVQELYKKDNSVKNPEVKVFNSELPTWLYLFTEGFRDNELLQFSNMHGDPNKQGLSDEPITLFETQTNIHKEAKEWVKTHNPNDDEFFSDVKEFQVNSSNSHTITSWWRNGSIDGMTVIQKMLNILPFVDQRVEFDNQPQYYDVVKNYILRIIDDEKDSITQTIKKDYEEMSGKTGTLSKMKQYVDEFKSKNCKSNEFHEKIGVLNSNINFN